MLLSIVSMYNYDNTIFDAVIFPDGIDKETAINYIMLKNAEFELIYSDIDTLKAAIGFWSVGRQWTWKRYAKIMSLDYDPIENYNREEEFRSNLASKSSTKSKTAVYNQADMVDNASAEGVANNTGINSGHAHGNIGVTTTQNMLRQEVEISERINIYDFIADDFKHRFCIMLY